MISDQISDTFSVLEIEQYIELFFLLFDLSLTEHSVLYFTQLPEFFSPPETLDLVMLNI